MAVVTIAFSELDAWLQAQPANTVDTPYELNITGLTASDCGSSLSTGTFGNVLRNNNTKFVDISYTGLPSDLTSLFQCFDGCKNIIAAPNIPNGVVNMTQAFLGCSNLVESPVIPQGVTSLERTFEGCTSLTVAPDIPSSVTNMFTTFLNCSALTETPLIPSGLEFIGMCFSGCTSLVTAKFIDPSSTVYATVSTFDYIFTHCSALTTFLSDRPYETKTWLTTVKNKESGSLPNAVNSYTFELLNSPAEIPISLLDHELSALSANTVSTPYQIKVTELTASDITSLVLGSAIKENTKYVDISTTELPNVTSLLNCFAECAYLTNSPAIPNTVTNMEGCFSGCTSLSTSPAIPNSVTNLDFCFDGCTAITTTPAIPNTVLSMKRCFRGCTALTEVINLSNAATSLEGCFQDCAALATVPAIPNTVTNMNSCFYGCTSLVDAPMIPALVTDVITCFSGCTNLESVGIASMDSILTGNKYNQFFWGCKKLHIFYTDEPTKIYDFLKIPENFQATIATDTSETNGYALYIAFTQSRPPEYFLMNGTFYFVSYPYQAKSATIKNDLFYGTFPASVTDVHKKVVITDFTKANIENGAYMEAFVTQSNQVKLYDLSLNVVPNTVTSLYQAFANCSGLVIAPQLPNVGNGTIITTAEACFYGCTNLLADGLPTEWWVPNMERCFYQCSALNISISRMKAITLKQCFYRCTSLRNSPRELIGLPSVTDSESPLYGVEQSLSGVFSGCSALNLLPDKIENFSEVVSAANKTATEGCRSVIAWNFDVINSNISWFGYGLINLASLTIRGSGGKYEMAFCGCANISSVVCKIMNAENIIGMFVDCTGFTDASEIVINGSPNGSPSANGTFSGCTSMTNFPHLSEFADYESCFEDCTGVTAIPASMANNTEYKFTSLSPMTTANVDGMFTGAANFKKAFKGCTSLASIPVNIRIHDSDLTSCFEGCTGLVNVELDDSALSGTFGMNDCTKMFYDCDNMESLILDTQAFGNISYIANSCGKLETLDITMTGVTDASYAFCGCALNDIHFDIEGNDINCTEMFHSAIEGSNVNIRGRITGVLSLMRAFMEDGNLYRSINFENVMFSSKTGGNGSVFLCFNYAWLSKPPRFVGFKSLERCFTNCYTVDLTGYQLPEGVENLNCCFEDAITLSTSPACVIPDSVKTMKNCFKGSVGLTTIPVIPEGVTDIESAFSTETSTGLTFQSITEVPNVPSTVTNAKNAFKGRSAITNVNSFCIPKENLDSENYQDMFSGCTALTAINVPETAPAESDEWHLVLLDFTATNVSGKIYDSLKNEVAIASTQITKGNLVLPFYTDELLFSTKLSVAELEAICDRLLEYKYTYTTKDVIPPDKQSFVLWAQNPENFITNINFSGSARAILNIVYPVGAIYTQYPKQKSPVELYPFFTWEVLDYGGAFFRSEGGNADSFDANVKAITAVSGNTITIVDHGAAVGTVIYDFENNESRVVTAVSGNVLTLDSQFTTINLRNVLIGQKQGLPNVTSKISNFSDRVWFPNIGGSGALFTSDVFTNYTGSVWEGGKCARSLNLDLSRSNSIYGASDNVQPSNFTKKIWVRIS